MFFFDFYLFLWYNNHILQKDYYMKREFIDAKHKLKLMEKLYKFHEGVMALSIPDEKYDKNREDFASSLRLYAKEYCKLLKQCLADNRDTFLEIYGDCDDKKFENFFKYHAKDLFELSVGGAWLVQCDKSGFPIANNKILAEDLGYRYSIKEMIDSLKNTINHRMHEIRFVLKRMPKPKVNIFQKIFGRKKYFEFKRTSVR